MTLAGYRWEIKTEVKPCKTEVKPSRRIGDFIRTKEYHTDSTNYIDSTVVKYRQYKISRTVQNKDSTKYHTDSTHYRQYSSKI
jgi:hypothetical protein